jgi:hypothetical protein
VNSSRDLAWSRSQYASATSAKRSERFSSWVRVRASRARSSSRCCQRDVRRKGTVALIFHFSAGRNLTSHGRGMEEIYNSEQDERCDVPYVLSSVHGSGKSAFVPSTE